MEKFNEIKVKVYLLKDINKRDCGEKIGELINQSMLKNPVLQKLHLRNGYKFYCFDYLYPIEKDGIYKANNIYEFRIRGLVNLNEINMCINKMRNKNMVVLTTEKILLKNQMIKSVKNITPMVSTITENGKPRSFNVMYDDVEYIKRQVFNNLEKKFKTFHGIEFKTKYDDIFESISMLHKYPIIINYKNRKLFGYKFKIDFKQNEIAQQYANFSMLVGIGEKNSSIGCGYLTLNRGD